MGGKARRTIALTLRAGTVYYMQHHHLHSGEPHYLVVLNKAPLADEVLLLVVPSSRLETVKQRRQAMPAETLVETGPTEYGDFTKPTIIDCNTLLQLTTERLEQKWTAGEITHKQDLPAALLRRIMVGVAASPLISREHLLMII